MLKYIARRVLQFIPVFIGVTALLFALRNVVPGDPVRLIAGEKALSPEIDLQIRAAHDLVEKDADGKIIFDANNKPVPTPLFKQYIRFMSGLLRGDFGRSYSRNLDVVEIFATKFPYTAKLALLALAIEFVVGVSIGLIAAMRRHSFFDMFVSFITALFLAMPTFWLGMFLQLFFGVWCREWTNGAFCLPVSGAGGPFARMDPWLYYILPAVTLAMSSSAFATRLTRSQLFEVLHQDYIRTAKAKGLSRRSILVHHALKNAFIPVVTFFGLSFAGLLGGAIFTETVFGWPGIGYETYRALTQRDWPIVLGGVTLATIVVVVMSLLVDISYGALDPRIRLDSSKKRS